MRNFIGIFLISLATLALEISLIRFFSISQWYHFGFMVVSIALFGMAAAGTLLTLRKIDNPLHTAALLFSLTTLAGLFIANNLLFDPFEAVINYSHVLVLLLYYLILGLPFFFFGIIMAYAFSQYQKQAGKLYFFNLAGSALGTLAAIVFISHLNVRAVLVISLIGLIGSLFFINPLRQKYRTILTAIFIVANLLLLSAPLDINISKYKELSFALNVPGSNLIDTQYNSFSRVDVLESSYTRYAPGLSPSFRGSLPDQIGVTVDGGSMSSITRRENLDFLNHLPASIPYFITQKRKTLVLNSGTGLDVLVALQNNATVTAIESNPLLIDLLREDYADFSGNIYNEATVIRGSGRSFIKSISDNEKFDIIVVSLSGSVLGDAAGLAGLRENYLLTSEAFEDYYNALNEGGYLVITRWLLFPPRESLRLLSLALEIDPDADNIAMLRSWTTVTLVLSKTELDDQTIASIKDFANSKKLDIIYLPAEFSPNKNLQFEEPFYYNFAQSMLEDRNQFYQTYVLDVAAVSDDKPFYFNFFRLSKIRELHKISNQKWNPFLDSGFLTAFIFIQALLLAAIFILMPLAALKANKLLRIASKKPLAYFFAIGISYLFIEIVLIQKFILLLDHIIFSSSTVIFSMLLFSGFGALASQKLNIRSLGKVVALIFALAVLYSLFLDRAIELTISLGLAPKIAIAALLAAPLGFFMGFPFPLGIRTIKKELVSWAWAVNGSASVLSPILAILLALMTGYNLILIFAGVIYFAGLFFIAPLPFLSKART